MDFFELNGAHATALVVLRGGSVAICFSPFVSVLGRNRLFPFGIPALGIRARDGRMGNNGNRRKLMETGGSCLNG